MFSKDLQNTLKGYEYYYNRHGLSEELINAYALASAVAIKEDVTEGLKVSARAKELLQAFNMQQTGGTLWDLEKYAFANKTYYDILTKYYDVLKVEAQNKNLDSYLLYLEKNREPKERFYAPKRKQFAKFGLVDAYQGAIDDLYDIVCIPMPPGTGKTTLLKFFNSAVIGWFPLDYNLF